MDKDPKSFEQKAYQFLAQEDFAQAFAAYQQAANIYKRANQHKQAALCFASAASCWSKKSGEKTFYNAALSYQQAAREAQHSGDLEYAAMLYKYAAINYERDREFISFSDCFYQSKECYRSFLTLRLVSPGKIKPITPSKELKGLRGLLKRIFLWLALSLSWFVWGHGERPMRTILAGLLVIIACAVFYHTGYLIQEGQVLRPDFNQALYFSVITFTTVGYGDFTPLGLIRLVAMFEALSGIFIIPLFVIGLSRKYLRI